MVGTPRPGDTGLPHHGTVCTEVASSKAQLYDWQWTLCHAEVQLLCEWGGSDLRLQLPSWVIGFLTSSTIIQARNSRFAEWSGNTDRELLSATRCQLLPVTATKQWGVQRFKTKQANLWCQRKISLQNIGSSSSFHKISNPHQTKLPEKPPTANWRVSDIFYSPQRTIENRSWNKNPKQRRARNIIKM